MLGCIYAAVIDGWRISLVLPLGVAALRQRINCEAGSRLDSVRGGALGFA